MVNRTDHTRARSEASGPAGSPAGPQAGPQKAEQKRAVDLTEKSTGEKSLASPVTPHLPHERDERVGVTDAVPSEKVRQGYRDVKRGLQDTSRAPEADAAYDKLKK